MQCFTVYMALHLQRVPLFGPLSRATVKDDSAMVE